MLPKYEKGFKLFKAVDNPNGTVLPFDESKHIKKAEKPEEVQSFENVAEDDVDDIDFATDDNVEEIDFDSEEDEFPFDLED
jgi:hypothetical protein